MGHYLKICFVQGIQCFSSQVTGLCGFLKLLAQGEGAYSRFRVNNCCQKKNISVHFNKIKSSIACGPVESPNYE